MPEAFLHLDAHEQSQNYRALAPHIQQILVAEFDSNAAAFRLELSDNGELNHTRRCGWMSRRSIRQQN